MNFWQIVSLLGFVVSSYPFLIGPNNCGECIQQYSTETGEVACDCSSVSNSKHDHRNHGHHEHTTHPHYHHNHHETASQQPIIYSTDSPLTTNSVTNNPVIKTTSKCDPGCRLILHPAKWSFCYCITTASPSSTTSLNTDTSSSAVDTNGQIDITSAAATSTHLLTDILTSSSTLSLEKITTKVQNPTTREQKISASTFFPTQTSTKRTTLAPTVLTSKFTTTADICIILCAAQQGGDACNCSKPGLPG